jgi:dihydroorotate dehydrogenase (fumarate)
MSVDMTTRYLGFELRSPLAVSAGPLTDHLELLRRLEDAGAALAVLPSLFQEQVEHEEMSDHSLFQYGIEGLAETLDFFPDLVEYNDGPFEYLKKIERSKRAVSIPVVASLNGSSKGGWQWFAKQMQEAGADALEINIYHVPTDPGVTGAEIEQRYVDLVVAVRESITIPLAVKVGPFFTAMPNLTRRLGEAGADGLVLFNRYLEPDVDLETLAVRPHLELSISDELRLPLRWVGILAGQVESSLALSSGVHTAADALKALLVGADVVMLQSVLLQHGPQHLGTILRDLEAWLTDRGYESVRQIQGRLSWRRAADPSAFERSNYMRTIVSYTGKPTR